MYSTCGFVLWAEVGRSKCQRMYRAKSGAERCKGCLISTSREKCAPHCKGTLALLLLLPYSTSLLNSAALPTMPCQHCEQVALMPPLLHHERQAAASVTGLTGGISPQCAPCPQRGCRPCGWGWPGGPQSAGVEKGRSHTDRNNRQVSCTMHVHVEQQLHSNTGLVWGARAL